MTTQLGLDLEEQPRAPRAAVLRHAHLQDQPVPPDEALALEKKARRQDARVMEVFRYTPAKRLTPSDVQYLLSEHEPPPLPLLTSIRRSLTNLTRRGLLQHHPRDRRPGPRGARESTWSLA
jgi:hypothetical protein